MGRLASRVVRDSRGKVNNQGSVVRAVNKGEDNSLARGNKVKGNKDSRDRDSKGRDSKDKGKDSAAKGNRMDVATVRVVSNRGKGKTVRGSRMLRQGGRVVGWGRGVASWMADM
jgi:hypothetical protein